MNTHAVTEPLIPHPPRLWQSLANLLPYVRAERPRLVGEEVLSHVSGIPVAILRHWTFCGCLPVTFTDAGGAGWFAWPEIIQPLLRLSHLREKSSPSRT